MAAVGTLDLTLFSRLGLGVPASNALRALAIGATVAGCAALLARRRHPVPVFAGLWLSSVLIPQWTTLSMHPTLPLLVAFHAVVRRTSARVALPGWIALLVPQAITTAAEAAQSPDQRAVILVANIVLYLLVDSCVWWAGRWARRTEKDRDRVERQAQAVARAAVVAERGRIARELHDIVAHSVTVMVLQAAGGQQVIDTQPEAAAGALRAVEEVGKQAMSELRRLLVVLRATGPNADLAVDVWTADEAQQPGLADIDLLLKTVRGAGVSVHYASDGGAQSIDPSVGLAVYRTIQEALTNVTKHVGPAARAEVSLTWTPSLLTVEIRDHGRVAPAPATSPLSTGHGLLGLRERINLLGGQLVAGPDPEGGYRVTATLLIAGTPVSLSSQLI